MHGPVVLALVPLALENRDAPTECRGRCRMRAVEPTRVPAARHVGDVCSDCQDDVVTLDSPDLRKARGAFYTPEGITSHLATWAIRERTDSVLEPSAGEAAFLVAAVERLKELGNSHPIVNGVEIHRASADAAREIVRAAGGEASIHVSDFFLVESAPKFDVVIGNPPFIRYQDFVGEARERSRAATLRQGVELSGLASSWAAFVIHSASFLKYGGRLGLVVPAELLSVNYAGPVRRFLLDRFESVELVLFEEQVFPDAEADTVLIKAEGFGMMPKSATWFQTRNAISLTSDVSLPTAWNPDGDGARWTSFMMSDATVTATARLLGAGNFTPLQEWGETSLGAVTGANRYFALSPTDVEKFGIPRRDRVRISPPGSSHLRLLALTDTSMTRLGRDGKATWLLYPSDRPHENTLRYLEQGLRDGIADAYKCRVRKPWHRVPILQAPDLFLTYMNADTARLTTNEAGVRHLNSVHGVYLRAAVRELAREVLPVASLNSLTLLSAELEGRSYGGGILKIEPREADRWWMPSSELVAERADDLRKLKPRVQRMLQAGHLRGAVDQVDEVVFGDLPEAHLASIRSDHATLAARRTTRGQSGR